MLIDCDACTQRHTSACEDCLVTVLLQPRRPLVILEPDIADAVGALAKGGLAPALRYRPDAPRAAAS